MAAGCWSARTRGCQATCSSRPWKPDSSRPASTSCWPARCRHRASPIWSSAWSATFGAVISASHNLFDDNGIKFFDRSGAKLADELEEAIESHLDEPALTLESGALGRATRVDSERTLYQSFCASTLPTGTTLAGMKLVIDCANGATYKVAPRVLSDLGAEIIPIGCSPNGRNINDGCGSTNPGLLKLTVSGVRADAGIALDGDGDRVVMVDHLGRSLDGDQLLYVLARARLATGELKGPVVGTVMTNLGLEVALAELGVPFLRAAVGDRNVLQLMRTHGGSLGGESSGHLLCLDKTTTGDGLIVALQVLAVMKATGKTLAELAAGMQKFPQQMINVQVARRFDAAADKTVAAAIARVEQELGKRGRVVLARLGYRARHSRHGRGRGCRGGRPARRDACGSRARSSRGDLTCDDRWWPATGRCMAAAPRQAA